MKILFVCEGNINRSQMAAVFFASLVPEAEVSSAGVYADDAGKTLSQVPGGSVEVMRDIGFDMSSHIVRQLTPDMVRDADQVILMEPILGGPVPEYLLNSPKLETWHVPDPGYGQISTKDARDMVQQLVQQLASRLK